jgi:hypothetical protein
MNAKEPASALIDDAKADYDFVFPTGLICTECGAQVWQAHQRERSRLTFSLWFCDCTRSVGQIVPGTWQPSQDKAEAAK